MNILISDHVAEKCIINLQSAGFSVDYSPGLAAGELLKKIGTFHGLIVRSATQVTRDVLEAGKNLKAIGRAGTGVDNIDVACATEKGIAVFNSRSGNTISAAEHTFALMMALARNIPAAHISMQNNSWERKRFMGVELFEKTLGIVGFGQIGREVAARGRAFAMKILAYDPLIPDVVFRECSAESCTLNDLFHRSDFVTIHVPLNEDTRHFVGEKQLRVCKSGLRLVNASRGGVVDEDALYHALQDGRLAGAALDVFEQEPPASLKLLELENFIATPHLGASTKEGQERVASEIAAVIADYLTCGKTRNLINPECNPNDHQV